MKKEEIQKVLLEFAMDRCGFVSGTEFAVFQGPFAESSHKYVAFVPENDAGEFYFDTPEEFFDGFIINGRPIGEQLKDVTDFYVVSCE